MAAIAGINKPDKIDSVNKMLKKLSHRGKCLKEIFSTDKSTLGIITDDEKLIEKFKSEKIIKDSDGFDRLAEAKELENLLVLKRDKLGIAPLYYGFIDDTLYFASEVKALIGFTKNILELKPGCNLINNQIEQYYSLEKKDKIKDDLNSIAAKLFNLLKTAVEKRIQNNEAGCWLSGGLDSSVIASLARQNVKRLFTFSAGIKNAPDLKYARDMADYLNSEHHEVVVSFEDMLKVLPEVIYHLESFDALLVRSSITNFFAGRESSNYVDKVFSGEGGDELFAGYEYLKSIPKENLDDELIDITNRLHNTALQRVDRCSSAFGVFAYVPFLDSEVVEFALQIPAEYKIYNGIEKWILRQSMKGILPEEVFNRKKAKFWEGAGVSELLSEYANQKISDYDFNKEKKLKNGWLLRSKEELLYYKIFKEHFGELENLDWMGRTKI